MGLTGWVWEVEGVPWGGKGSWGCPEGPEEVEVGTPQEGAPGESWGGSGMVPEVAWGGIKGSYGSWRAHWMGLGDLKGSLGEERSPGGVLRVLGRWKGIAGFWGGDKGVL